MGVMIDGRWEANETLSALTNTKGEFIRAESVFRNRIEDAEGATHPPGSGRYHVFLAHGWPWAHRVEVCLKLKGLEDKISISFAQMPRDEGGWSYDEGMDGVGGEKDTDREENGQINKVYLHEFYTVSQTHYSGRVTTPTLWDRQARTVVNNESSEILRMFNTQFNAHGAGGPDLYPEGFREEIDRVNEAVYHHINNGVYRCGFAHSQEAYEEAFRGMFETLDMLEARLKRHRYLVGKDITEADLRLFPTLVRFDAVYYSHFKCNLRRIADYPNLSNYLRDLFQMPQFGSTVNIEQYKRGYYGNSPRLNPSGIIPLGPELLLDAPHDRATRSYYG